MLIRGVVANVRRRRRPSEVGRGRAVGHHLPVGGGGHGDVEGGLEVGLVEAGEHPLGVGGFELGVEVDLVVDGVDEAVQALAGVGVPAVGVDDEVVALRSPGSVMPVRLVVAGDVEVGAVEHAQRIPAATMSM